MDFSTYEYTVEQKSEGKFLLRRVLFIFLYIMFVLAWVIFGVVTRIGVPLLALIPLTTAILVFFTWLYCHVEYEYSVTSGVITFTRIFGNRRRVKAFDVTIKNMDLIASWDDGESCKRAEANGVDRSYFFISSKSAPNVYFAAFENEKGKKCIVYFEADDKMIRLLKFYNTPAFATVKK